MRAWVSAVAILCSISSALADPADYSRVVAFGDSLQDNGNLFKNSGGLSPQSPPYDQRFSNGPTWIELVSAAPLALNHSLSSNPSSSMNNYWGGSGFSSGPYNVTGNVNAAVGGAQTTGDVPTLLGFSIPAVDTQINSFLSHGGSFGANDLVSVQGGANNFFNGNFNATQIAASDAANVDLAAKNGAKTVLVSNLPDVGQTPAYYGGPFAGVGTSLAQSYNTTLNQDVQALASSKYPGVNFVQMDWYSALNVIIANPAAFGFTNLHTACVQKDLGGNITSVCSNPNTYLFWDDVHPTEAAQQLLARYADLLLSTEETGKAMSALGQVALSNRLDASDIIFRRGATPGADKPGGLYAEVIGSTASFNGTNTTTYGATGYNYSLGGVRAGFDANSGPVSFGSALAYQTGSLSGDALGANLATTQIDAYALRRFSPFFVGVEGGVSWNSYYKTTKLSFFGDPMLYGIKGSFTEEDLPKHLEDLY